MSRQSKKSPPLPSPPPSPPGGPPDSEPWKAVLAGFWVWGTRGYRKYLTVPVFIAFVFIPGAVTFLQSYDSLITYFRQKLEDRRSYPTADEWDVLDASEWVILLETVGSEQAAQETKKQFVQAYTDTRQDAWVKKVLVVRSPTHVGLWWVVIDALPDQSNADDMEAARFAAHQLANRMHENAEPLRRFLANAQVAQYSKVDFENTYGQIARRSPPASSNPQPPKATPASR